MKFPSDETTHLGVPIDLMSKYLRSKHSGRFMVWNLSEKTYDYTKFEDQVHAADFFLIFFAYPSALLLAAVISLRVRIK